MINLRMLIDRLNNGRLQCLLLFCFTSFIISCKPDKEVSVKDNNHKNAENSEKLNEFDNKDSLTISVFFNEKSKTGFNVTDLYHFTYNIGFQNKQSDTATIVKRIISPHESQIINFGIIRLNKGEYEIHQRNFLINKKYPELKVIYEDNDIQLKNKNSNILDVSKIHNSYEFITSNNVTSANKHLLEKKLDSTFLEYSKFFSNNRMILEVNNLYYYSKLQFLSPYDKNISKYLQNLENPISSIELQTLLFFYIKNRIEDFSFKDITQEKYSKNHIDLLSKGLYGFLKHEDNKGDKKYQLAVDWLKTTDLYKKDSIYIKKEITPINNEVFKKHVKDLTLIDTKNVAIDLKQIIKENSSSYYLIDFWATWCAPCIQGVKTMKEMQLPKNVKVISISVDKGKDKQKWINMTNRLEQSITYWLDETNDNTKEFVKFIEMQSIPRYILIDKNMNLIDQAFYHPQEPQFLPKLKDVKNNKFW